MLEIEAKFLNVNISELVKKIKKCGGKKIHKMVMYNRNALSGNPISFGWSGSVSSILIQVIF
jgi:hypothetical protein